MWHKQQTKNKNLVFASVGDKSKHRRFWLNEQSLKNFDLWLCYYGNDRGRYEADAEYYAMRKGSKWQNFYFIWNKLPNKIASYDCVLVLDDDIEISTRKLDDFFEVFHKYQLSLAQPAYTWDSYTSWNDLKQELGTVLRFTNFVENGVMAFSKEALKLCYSVIGEVISGVQLDWICSEIVGAERKIAVIDQVSCRHPYRKSELDRLMPRSLRQAEGQRLIDRYKIADSKIVILDRIVESNLRIVFLLKFLRALEIYFSWMRGKIGNRALKKFLLTTLSNFIVKIKRQVLRIHEQYPHFRFVTTQAALTKVLGPLYQVNKTALEIDLTYACNLKCLNCNRSCPDAPSADRISMAQIRKFVAESIQKNRQWERIEIAGGEPALHPECLEIIRCLVGYRDSYLSHCRIILTSNGFGDKVNSTLKLLSKENIIINNTQKIGSEQYFEAIHMAPRDLTYYQTVDYSNGCWIPNVCGMGLTPYGYYPCAVAGSIDRVFGFNAGRKRLPDSDDAMSDLLRLFCQYCGHFIGVKTHKNTQTISWKKKLEKYFVSRPEMTKI